MTNGVEQPLVASESEERIAAACLADTSTLGAVKRFGLAVEDFGDPRVIPVMEAIFYCADGSKWPDGKPRTVERANVILALQQLSYWGREIQVGGRPFLIGPEWLRQLDNEGTDAVVRSADEHAAIVLQLSIARTAAAEAEDFARSVRTHPNDVGGLVNLHVSRMTTIATHTRGDADYSIQAINQASIEPVPGILTGMAWMDVTAMGMCESEMIGVQGMQKKGKTRLTIGLVISLLKRGFPLLYITTDGTAVMFRNRLLCVLATAKLAKWEVPRHEWTLDPRRLNPKRFSRMQAKAIDEARKDLDGFRLWVLDAASGIQDFDTMGKQLYRHVHYLGARVWVYDHIADLTLRGSNDVQAFNFMVRTMKTWNIAWHTTAILVNQRPETINRGTMPSRGAGSYMGGALPQAVDHLLELDDEIEQPDLMGVILKMSRWGYTGSKMLFTVNPSSGLILNRGALPDDLLYLKGELKELYAGVADEG